MATHMREMGIAQYKQRQEARRRFQNIVRSVIFNKRWLMDKEEQKLTLNVKKNISTLVRTYQKIGVLTMVEKSFIRIPHENRTVEQRKMLVKTLSGLLCFAGFPPKIRARLVPCINFTYISSDHRLIKEGDEPMMLYFILTGEVAVSRTVYNEATSKYDLRPDMIHGPGDCIGEVELIENCRRISSYTAVTDVELLVVYWDDFDRILRPFMSKQWADKKRALKELEYFHHFSPAQLITACQMSVIRQFDPLENIYYEDKGQGTYVHFVLSGECMVLQLLKINVIEKKGEKTFELSKYIRGETLFNELSNVEVMKMLREEHFTEMQSVHSLKELLSDEDNNKRPRRRAQKISTKAIEISCGIRSDSDEAVQRDKVLDLRTIFSMFSQNLRVSKTESFQRLVNLQKEASEEELMLEGEEGEFENENGEEPMSLEKSMSTRTVTSRAPSIRISPEAPEEHRKRRGPKSPRASKEHLQKDHRHSKEHRSSKQHPYFKSRRESKERRGSKAPRASKDHHHTLDQHRSSRHTADPRSSDNSRDSALTVHSEESSYSDYSSDYSSGSSDSQLSTKSSVSAKSDISSGETVRTQKFTKRRENHFIDVGSITYGGIFGLGEALEHRVIMARTTVQCLMIPRFWLLERTQNPANLWNRRCFFLEKSLPSRKDLFHDFLTTLNWDKFKNNYIRSQAKFGESLHNTKPQDVPVYGRILQPNDNI